MRQLHGAQHPCAIAATCMPCLHSVMTDHQDRCAAPGAVSPGQLSVEEHGEDDVLAQQQLKQLSSEWPKFGIVGESQAALYGASFIVFSVFFFRNNMAAQPAAMRKTGSC